MRYTQFRSIENLVCATLQQDYNVSKLRLSHFFSLFFFVFYSDGDTSSPVFVFPLLLAIFPFFNFHSAIFLVAQHLSRSPCCSFFSFLYFPRPAPYLLVTYFAVEYFMYRQSSFLFIAYRRCRFPKRKYDT